MKDTTAQWMQDNLLDFDVVKEKLIHPRQGTETRFYGLYNQSYDGRFSNDVFRVVTDEYKVYDNNSLALLTEKICDTQKVKIEDCRVRMNKGFNIIVVEIPMGKFEIPVKKRGDVVDKYIRISEDRTGVTGLNIGLYNVVLSCTNGMTTTERKTRFNLSHSSLLEHQLNLFQANLPDFINGQQIFEEKCYEMARRNIDDYMVKKVVEMAARLEVKNAVESKNTRIIDKIMQSVETEISEKGATKYGLFNGITRYFTHEYGNPDNRLKSSLPNGYTDKKQKMIFDFLN